MAVESCRRTELIAKHSEISAVISVEYSGTGSRKLFKAAAMSCAVSALAIRVVISSSKPRYRLQKKQRRSQTGC